jgi:uncharacterized protein
MQPTSASPGSWASFARQVVERAARNADTARVCAPEGESRPYGGIFVTLHKFRRLRGCMGTLDTTRSLAEAVRYAATCAAMHDPRFPPMGPGELADVAIEVSILSAAWPMRDISELELGRHSILVRSGMHQGLFLPQVATEHHLDREAFLSRCCSEKAGLPPEAWRQAGTEVLLFTTQVFVEEENRGGTGTNAG